MTRTSHVTAPRLKTVAIGIACLATVGVAGAVLGDRVPPLDSWIAGNLYASPDTASADVATALSGVGSVLALLVLVAAGWLLWRRRSGRFPVRHGILLAACLTPILLQAVFQRSGPAVSEQDWTYPSGHVVVLTAVGFTAVVMSGRLRSPWRIAILAVSAAAILLVASSRVALGEHYLIDVVAALVATSGVGLLAAVALGLLPAGSSVPERLRRA